VPRGNEKPSFDCAKAKTAAARLICADGELARLDGELSVAFQKWKADQLAWIRDRNTRCELDGKNSAAIEVLASSKRCMAARIQERIAFLTHIETTTARKVAPSVPASAVRPSSDLKDTSCGRADAGSAAALCANRYLRRYSQCRCCIVRALCVVGQQLAGIPEMGAKSGCEAAMTSLRCGWERYMSLGKRVSLAKKASAKTWYARTCGATLPLS
jgi:uncharacterized protein YecT (DUF1311 family)